MSAQADSLNAGSARPIRRLAPWRVGELVLGHYRIEDMIPGGMGNIFIATHTQWDRKLAIKVPNEKMLADEAMFSRILREAEAWTRLGLHPNIAYCYFVRKVDGVPCIFVEYVDGGSLEQWIAQGRCTDPRTSLNMAIQFCHGMVHAHAKGMIHRDIKPANILISGSGIVKITDFGLVRGQSPFAECTAKAPAGFDPADEHLTSPGTIMGTVGYMAPEQVTDASSVDGRCDIFSFGVCLFEMFCGKRPYQDTCGPAKAAPNPLDLGAAPGLSEPLAEVMIRCVDWEPAKRWDSFAAIAGMLVGIYQDIFGEPSPFAAIDTVGLEADGLNNQGVSFLELDQEEEACRCWRLSIQNDPAHPEASFNLALWRWRQAQIDDLEVLRLLENCRNKPDCDQQTITELIAAANAERLAPDRNQTAADAPDPRAVELDRLLDGHDGTVIAVDIDPAGQMAVSGGWDATVRVWNLASGAACLHTLAGHANYVTAVCLSQCGRRVLSASYDGTLRLWDALKGRCLRVFSGHKGAVFAAAILDQRQLAFSGGEEKVLKIWGLDAGGCIATLDGHDDWIKALAVLADQKHVLTAGADGVLILWDIDKRRSVRVFTGHQASVNAVALLPDGRAVSGSTDKTLRIWDLAAGRCDDVIAGHTNPIHAVAAAADGSFILSAGWGGHTVRVWQLPVKRCLRTLTDHHDNILGLAVSRAGGTIVSASADKTVGLWRVRGGPIRRAGFRLSKPRGYGERQQARALLDQALAEAGRHFAGGDYRRSAATLLAAWKAGGFRFDPRLIDLYTRLSARARVCAGLILHYRQEPLRGHRQAIAAVAVSKDGSRLLSAGADRTVRVWDTVTGQCLHHLTGHEGQVNAVAFALDGTVALSGGWDNTLRLWNLKTERCLVMVGHHGPVNGLAVSPDMSFALSASSDQTLRQWDLNTGFCRHVYNGHGYRVTAVSLAPDGKRFVSAGADNTLILWKTGSAERPVILFGHRGAVTTVAWGPASRRIVSGSADKTLKVWDPDSGQCRGTLEGHTEAIRCLALTLDGRWAFSVAADQTLRLWDLANQKCTDVFKGGRHGFKAVAATDDGALAVTGGLDKTVGRWQFVWKLGFGE
jgi:WD40 repeat protein